ncbi:MAG: acyltransferase family protein [Deltaproteobacteria bacterium]|nr:acyltransferase family protein [Deltaproteobacteria bacterium]
MHARVVPSTRHRFDRRDPSFIRTQVDRIGVFFDRYHRLEVDGLERVPSGRALVVGNHNGGLMSPDMFGLMVAWWRSFGADAPAYGLMHDMPFRLPLLGDYMARLGAVPAHPANAHALLERDAKVLVYPGGDLDAFRPWARRHEIVFGERRGFVRVALRARAPIVPVVSAGAHEGCLVLTDGRRLADALGLRRMRIEVLPICVGLPWGIWLGAQFYVPVPVTIRIRVLDPIAWPELPPEAADDDAIVRRCRDEVVARMQTALDELTREGGFGFLARHRPASAQRRVTSASARP